MNFQLFIWKSKRAKNCKFSALVYENDHFVIVILIDNCSFFENTPVIDSIYIYFNLKMSAYITVKTNKQTNLQASMDVVSSPVYLELSAYKQLPTAGLAQGI